jgi:hypothetical protein
MVPRALCYRQTLNLPCLLITDHYEGLFIFCPESSGHQVTSGSWLKSLLLQLVWRSERDKYNKWIVTVDIILAFLS